MKKILENLYDDALSPSAKEFGKAIAIIPRKINSLLSPVYNHLYFDEKVAERTKELISQKVENIDPDLLVPPDTYVAVPALQSLSYSIDSEDLQNMYANLLAKSIVKTSKGFVHPSFVESLKQMSPLDAQLFQKLLQKRTVCLIDLVSLDQYDKELDFYKSYDILESNIIGLDLSSHDMQSASLCLLERLGFISIIDKPLDTDNEYSAIMSSQEYQQLKSKHIDALNLDERKKSCFVTDFGTLFSKICLRDDFQL